MSEREYKYNYNSLNIEELTSKDIITDDLGRLFPANNEASRLVIKCPRHHYLASELARAVEDCDANVLNLNVTADTTPDSQLLVELRVDRRDAQAVARNIERYGYQVLQCHDAIADDDARPTAIDELIRYLNI